MKKIIFFLFTILLISCNSDDDNAAANACELERLINVEVIDGITQKDFVISEYQGGFDGYLVTSTIININDFPVTGESVYVIKINGRVVSYYNQFSCEEIEANSTCEYERSIFGEAGEPYDPNAELLCFYYLK